MTLQVFCPLGLSNPFLYTAKGYSFCLHKRTFGKGLPESRSSSMKCGRQSWLVVSVSPTKKKKVLLGRWCTWQPWTLTPKFFLVSCPPKLYKKREKVNQSSYLNFWWVTRKSLLNMYLMDMYYHFDSDSNTNGAGTRLGTGIKDIHKISLPFKSLI